MTLDDLSDLPPALLKELRLRQPLRRQQNFIGVWRACAGKQKAHAVEASAEIGATTVAACGQRVSITGQRNPRKCVPCVRRQSALKSLANYRVAAPTNSIEQPHQSKIPSQPQGEGEQSP